jgi:uncharacterized membrane protein
MALMALDHTRDFFGSSGLNPRDVTDPALFLTRWITHFCAPTFIFLAGVAAYLYGTRGRSTTEVCRYLLIRGFFLILLEFTVIKIAWSFSLRFDQLSAGVIWTIGASMMALAALVYLPRAVVAAVAVAMIAGHNLLDGVRAENLGRAGRAWHVLHQPGLVRFDDVVNVYVVYPLIPWIGVMALGYALGPVMTLDIKTRRRWLLRLGGAITVGFVLLRATNLYGDPVPWTMQETWSAAVLSFLNCEKYPPSLLFLVMTLGPALLLFAAFDHAHRRAVQWLRTFGRVPLLFYVIHLYVIHGMAIVFAFATRSIIGLSLPEIYLIWLIVLGALYPLCFWFAELKQRRTEWWWSYV